jgi:branched-subunit amino acid aminotransferase/4-amino-4-deoxychorismate lyase
MPAQVLNYGQSVFEGMKAQRSARGRVVLFRPDENAARMMAGARPDLDLEHTAPLRSMLNAAAAAAAQLKCMHGKRAEVRMRGIWPIQARSG